MPNLFLADMVRELSSSTGTGAFALDGATPGHRSFAAALSSNGQSANATFPYAICGVSDESQWETGEGTLSATGQLIRSPKDSSAGGALVPFGAGLKTVALSVGANWYAARDSINGHNHAIGAITGLTAELTNKADIASTLPVTNYLQSTDKIAAMRGNTQLAVTGSTVVAQRTAGGPLTATGDLRVTGMMTGGFGAQSIGAGAPDWDDISNAISGQGARLMSSSDTNGPPRGNYWHPFSFEYGTRSGGANMTQFAVPYYDSSNFFGFRCRFGGVWSSWRGILTENAAGQFLPRADNVNTLGVASIRFSTVYAGSGAINTSDERQKTDIGPIPDEWLDAWGDVAWCRFRFNGGKRWHAGLIAQRVHAAFAARGLDAFTIGLCCFDTWDEERAPILDEDGNATGEGDVTRKAGDLWGLRYDECFAMEAAWTRRELSRLLPAKGAKR